MVEMSSEFLPPIAPPKFAIDYIKSGLFRASHVDGVIGTVTPAGKLHVICFSERGAVPRRQVFTMDPEGKLHGPLHDETVSRGSVVREMDVDLIMDLPVAESIMSWLADRVAEMRAVRDQVGSSNAGQSE